MAPTRLAPAPFTPLSHRSITSIEIAGSQLSIAEGERSTPLPITSDWSTIDGGWLAASAAAVGPDRVALDVVVLDTPHRLEIELDLHQQRFSATWPRLPLFGGGITPTLATMRAPSDRLGSDSFS